MRRFAKPGTLVLLGGAALLFAGCAAYTGITRHRCQAWEARQGWNADGTRTGCEPISAGKGSPALLMVHGFGDNPSVWKPMMEDFTARGYHCRAMLLPGFGDRLATRKSVTEQSWLDALDKELMRLSRDHAEIWLVGHSTGASVCVRHVLENPGPSPIKGLVLLSPLIEVSRVRSPLLSPRTWHNAFKRWIGITETPFPEDQRKPAPPDRVAVERFITPNINDALFSLIDFIAPRAKEITLPLFVAVSPHDHVTSPAASLAWHDQASAAPVRRLFLAGNSAHVLPLDHDADALVREIDDFIRR